MCCRYFLCSPSYWRGDLQDFGDIVANTDKQADVEAVSDAMQSKLALRVQGLGKVFYSNGIQKVAVNNLNLEVYRGQITALLGHNGSHLSALYSLCRQLPHPSVCEGAGKTTTFNMLTGLIKPTSGDATLYGESIINNMAKVRSVLGTCPQHNVLW